jgi:hypothetical protein
MNRMIRGILRNVQYLRCYEYLSIYQRDLIVVARCPSFQVVKAYGVSALIIINQGDWKTYRKIDSTIIDNCVIHKLANRSANASPTPPRVQWRIPLILYSGGSWLFRLLMLIAEELFDPTVSTFSNVGREAFCARGRTPSS